MRDAIRETRRTKTYAGSNFTELVLRQGVSICAGVIQFVMTYGAFVDLDVYSSLEQWDSAGEAAETATDNCDTEGVGA